MGCLNLRPRAQRRLVALLFIFLFFIIGALAVRKLHIITQFHSLNYTSYVPLAHGYEPVQNGPQHPVAESIVVVVHAVGGTIVARPNLPPYSLKSISALLTSLGNARYTHPVHLRILLAPQRDPDAFNLRYALASSVSWSHGSKDVVNATSGGLFELMVSAWSPAKGTVERAVIVDAAFARSFHPNWFQYLQATRARYAGFADVAAFSPVHASVRTVSSITGIVSHWQPPPADAHSTNSDNVFLYQSAAYAPVLAPANAEIWRTFQRWFANHRSEWFLWPGVVQPKDRLDHEWKGFTARGRAHWSMWYSRFLAEHGMYILYPREEIPSIPPPIAMKKPIGELMRVTFDGSVVQPPQNTGGATDQELNEIVRKARLAGGSVAITIVTEPFVETARSWICNVKVAGFRPKAVVWIAPDNAAYEALKSINGSTAIHMQSFKGGREATGTHFNSPGYWLLMLERTRLIRDLLERGIGVFAFETDQIWLRDPQPAVRRILDSGDGVDLVGTLDTRNQIAGNFLYMAPTVASKHLWREIAKRFSDAYHAAGMHRKHFAKYERYIENDQSILTRLVFYDKDFKRNHGIVFRALDTDRFVDGRWYEGKKFYGAAAQSPTMINNNFLVGIAPKIERAKKWGHWFWDAEQEQCDAEAVKKAIEDNEDRGEEAQNAAKRKVGSNAEAEHDYDVGIDRAIVGISKSLKKL